jgi:formate-dependent nitrite reductase membrane component NrfD
MGVKTAAFWIFTGVAGICIAIGILLVLAEKKKNKKRRFGHALLVLAAVFVVIAIEFLLWPGSS